MKYIKIMCYKVLQCVLNFDVPRLTVLSLCDLCGPRFTTNERVYTP